MTRRKGSGKSIALKWGVGSPTRYPPSPASGRRSFPEYREGHADETEEEEWWDGTFERQRRGIWKEGGSRDLHCSPDTPPVQNQPLPHPNFPPFPPNFCFFCGRRLSKPHIAILITTYERADDPDRSYPFKGLKTFKNHIFRSRKLNRGRFSLRKGYRRRPFLRSTSPSTTNVRERPQVPG